MRALALALACGCAAPLSACRTPAARGPAVAAAGLTLVIDEAADGSGAVVQVDDRRTIDVPARGTIELARVSPSLAIDSVVLEAPGGPAALRVEGCALLDHAAAFASGWLLGRAVAVTTVGGAEIAGTVVELGEPTAQVRLAASAGVEVEVPLAQIQPFALREREDPTARVDVAAPPPLGTMVLVPDVAGDEVGVLAGFGVRSLVVHDDAGVRHAIRADAIARLRIPELPAAPTLRCRVRSARPGRQAVRLAYRYRGPGWQADYQVSAVDDATTSITLAPRYTIHLGALRGVGPASLDVTLRLLRAAAGDEAGGDVAAPLIVWRGTLPFAGDEGDVGVPGAPSTRAARVRRVYRGATTDAGDAHERGWGRDSTAEVWRELAFARTDADVAGALRIGVVDGAVTRWVGAALLPPAAGAKLVRVPLAIDPDLVGYRERLVHDEDGLADELRFSVANRGAAPAKVILEEPLRPIGRAAVRFAAPAVGTLSAELWQLEVTVAPGAIERAAVLLQYPPEP